MVSLFRTFPINHFSTIIKRTRTTAPKKKVKNYLILRPTPDDYPTVLSLMHKAYFREEPTANSLAYKPTVLFDERIMKGLAEGYTLVAKCRYNSDILGAAINETLHCWDPNLLDKLACQAADVKTRQLFHFYAHVMRVPDLWKKYCVQKIFEISYLFVRQDARGQGMAFDLANESRKLAADCGFTLMKMDATSHYTALIAEKMKMKLVAEVPYCSYVGADQRPIFNPPDPHKSCKIYIDDEPQKNSLTK